MNFRETKKVLKAYTEAIETSYINNLKNADKSATGELINSIDFNIKRNGFNWIVTLQLAEYWKYVEYGRKPGKMPPIEAMLKWIRVKNIIPRADKKGKVPSEKSLAFLIARSIGKKGIKPTNALENATDKINKEYKQKLLNALGNDFSEELINNFKQSIKLK